MEKSLTRNPIIRKQQVLKAVKMKWKKAVREGSSVMPWFLFRDMIRNGWFYVTYSR